MKIVGFVHKRYLAEAHFACAIGESWLLPRIYIDRQDLLKFYKEDEITEITITIE